MIFTKFFQSIDKTSYFHILKIMVPRPEYLLRLAGFKDKQLIKVVTGIRRCGKSTLLELFRAHLAGNGVAPEQIQAINLEDAGSAPLLDYKKLHERIVANLVPDRMNYIFLDEIQQVPDFQRAADSLFIKKNVDLYITGSNAHLLSGELATLLSGRYVEIPMLPFSFKEYLSFFDNRHDLSLKYRDYLVNSSFPYTLELRDAAAVSQPSQIRDYLGGIYSTIILKDVMERKKIADPLMLESVVRFMADNIGNLCSTKKICDTMVSAGRKISVNTVESYIAALRDSFIFYRLGRYDVKGKQHLKTGDKYYLADPGLRFYLLGPEGADMGRVLENVIFLELLRRRRKLSIGKVDTAEVDFVAEDDTREYYQVALTVRDKTTLERELRPLLAIKDHNPKYLLTMDDDPPASHNGIRQLNALDWLLA
jgi:predicted AAA+ superfamily ATPase